MMSRRSTDHTVVWDSRDVDVEPKIRRDKLLQVGAEVGHVHQNDR